LIIRSKSAKMINGPQCGHAEPVVSVSATLDQMCGQGQGPAPDRARSA